MQQIIILAWNLLLTIYFLMWIYYSANKCYFNNKRQAQRVIHFLFAWSTAMSFNYLNYAWHSSLEIAFISDGCASRVEFLKKDIWKTEVQESSWPEQDNALPHWSLVLSALSVRSFTIIAFTKSVLHNPVWNRFYSEDSERIVRAEFFTRFISTSTETAMSIWPIMFTFNLRLIKFTFCIITLHYLKDRTE